MSRQSVLCGSQNIVLNGKVRAGRGARGWPEPCRDGGSMPGPVLSPPVPSLSPPPQTIVMNDCIIRGDLANVRVGRHCVVKSRSVIRPPFKKFSKG